MKTYKNGNREVAISQDRDGEYVVSSNIWNGSNWHYGTPHYYKNAQNAERGAQKMLADISKGWTAQPNWTLSEF